MASKDIEQFANGISGSITDAVAVAKKDYRERLEAIDNIYNMPDMIIQAGGVSRADLAKGAEGEMQRVQREQIRAIEPEIKKDWIKKSEKLAIPKGSHSSAYTVSATKVMVDIQKKWEKFCQTDPTIQKASLYEQKAKLDHEIPMIITEIADLENIILCLKEELDDRSANGTKYEQQIKTEVSEEVEAISIELRHAEEDVRDLENQEKSIQTQLSSSGIFAFGKKKELKAQLEKMAADISNAKSKVLEIEKKKKTTADSLTLRIAALDDRLLQLKAEIENSEKKLEKDREKLSDMQMELAEVEAKL